MIYSDVNRLCSQREVSFRRMRFIYVYSCEGIGQSSSSVIMGITAVHVMEFHYLTKVRDLLVDGGPLI
jgi:hypothetical protein